MNAAVVCLPLVWLSLIFVFFLRTPEPSFAFLRGSLLTGALTVAGTEILNRFDALTRRASSVLWITVLGAVLALLVATAYRRREAIRTTLLSCSREHAPGSVIAGILRRLAPDSGTLVFRIFLLLWLALLLAVALASAPNNHDSMVYRLPRIMHWADNESVEFHAARNLHQNHRPPFAEWVLLHLYLLTRSDRFFNILQWISLGGCCVAVYAISRHLGGNRLAVQISVLLAATMPLAVLQATSTQNDLVASFVFLTFLVFGLRMSEPGLSFHQRLFEGVFCGAALGLGLLTKFTVLLFGGVFAFWFGIRAIRAAGWSALPAGALCGFVALVVVAGHSSRTIGLFGHPLGPREEHHIAAADDSGSRSGGTGNMNAAMNTPYFVSNLVRNVAMHFATSARNVNDAVIWTVWRVHDVLGIPPDEPAITWKAQSFRLFDVRHEDVTGNLPQTLLFAAAFCLLPFRARGPTAGYGLCIFAAIIVFCLMLRWQPWHTRLHLPLYLALCPLASIILKLGDGPLRAGLTGGFLICHALPFVIDNATRPVFGERSVFLMARKSLYFRGDHEKLAPFEDAARLIKQKRYKLVGLEVGGDDVHYPIWPLLRKATKKTVIFKEVNVSNVSGGLAKDSPPPDAILSTLPEKSEVMEVDGRKYARIWQSPPLSIFELTTDGADN